MREALQMDKCIVFLMVMYWKDAALILQTSVVWLLIKDFLNKWGI